MSISSVNSYGRSEIDITYKYEYVDKYQSDRSSSISLIYMSFERSE